MPERTNVIYKKEKENEKKRKEKKRSLYILFMEYPRIFKDYFATLSTVSLPCASFCSHYSM
jgi:hypothetical protein